jgi:hypothetical protein
MDESNSGGRDTILPTFARAQVRFVLIVLGLYFVGQGVYMALAPGSFFEYVGPYGPRNDHYLRDNASFSVALGLGCLVGLVRPRWQVPALAIVTAQFWLHALSHLVDIGEADPDIVGPVEFALLLVAAVVLTVSLVLATRGSDAQP